MAATKMEMNKLQIVEKARYCWDLFIDEQFTVDNTNWMGETILNAKTKEAYKLSELQLIKGGDGAYYLYPLSLSNTGKKLPDYELTHWYVSNDARISHIFGNSNDAKTDTLLKASTDLAVGINTLSKALTEISDRAVSTLNEIQTTGGVCIQNSPESSLKVGRGVNTRKNTESVGEGYMKPNPNPANVPTSIDLGNVQRAGVNILL